MKVKMRRNPAARYNCPLSEGQTGDVPFEIGSLLVSDGLAERIDEPDTIKAIPAQPAIAEAKPGSVEKATADLKAYKAKALGEEENKPATKAAETVSKPSTAKK